MSESKSWNDGFIVSCNLPHGSETMKIPTIRQLFLIIQRLLIPIRHPSPKSINQRQFFCERSQNELITFHGYSSWAWIDRNISTHIEKVLATSLCWLSSDDSYVTYTNYEFQELLPQVIAHPAIRTHHLMNQKFSPLQPIPEICTSRSCINYRHGLLDNNIVLPPHPHDHQASTLLQKFIPHRSWIQIHMCSCRSRREPMQSPMHFPIGAAPHISKTNTWQSEQLGYPKLPRPSAWCIVYNLRLCFQPHHTSTWTFATHSNTLHHN